MTNFLIYTLWLSIFVTSCTGQIKTEPQAEKTAQAIETLIGQPKMLKSQGKYTFHTATGPYSDTSVRITAIIEDKNGDIWVGTMGEGVYRFDGISFTNYTSKDGLATNLVYSILEDKDGDIWFGTTDGLSRYNGESFKNYSFSIINPKLNSFTEIKAKDPLKYVFNEYKEVWCMMQDRSGKIWLGTTTGVYCYDGMRFSSIADLDSSKNNSLKHLTVNSIVEDKAGNIWFSSWTDGLCRFDGKSITKISSDGEGFNEMLLDRNGNIWLGRRHDKEGGVYRFDGKTFTKLLLGMPYIWEMVEDENGNIWFNYPDGGVILYNTSISTIISHFSEKNGLPSNHITSITIDKSGKLWFGMGDLTLTSYNSSKSNSFVVYEHK